MLCFFAGSLWTLHHGYTLKAPFNELPTAYFSNQPVMATLKVTSIIDVQEKSEKATKPSLRFYAQVYSINETVLQNPFYIRLTWTNPSLIIKQGNKLNLRIKIKPAHSLANIGSFDYKSWLLTKDVIASAYVTKSISHEIINDESSLRQRWYDHYQEHFLKHYADESTELIPLILALVFGERSQFNDVHWQVLKDTGTQHLIAISGLHIGLVMAIAYGVLSVLVRVLPLRLLPLLQRSNLSHFNIQPILLFISFCVALGYGHLANLSIPTLRALTMIAVVLAIKLLGYRFSVTRTLLLCVVGVLIIQPLSVLSASFWLSFFALVIIFFTLWRFNTLVRVRRKWLRYVLSLVVLQLTLTLLMMPMTVFLFGQVSQVSLLANLVAVPVVSLVLMPVLLGSVLMMLFNESIALMLVDIGITVLAPLWQFLVTVGEYNQSAQVNPLSMFNLDEHFLFVFLVFLILLYGLMHVKLRIKFKAQLSAALVLAFCSSAFVKGQQEQWQMTVLDVGQGLAIVIIKHGRAIIYDTGAYYPSGFNMADSVILPYLHSQHIKNIDIAFISHDDNDHAGGLLTLANKVAIEQLVINAPSDMVKRAYQQAEFSQCLRGMRWQWQGLTISALHPSAENGDKNDDSCVISISDSQHSVLLTGDISRKIEVQLVNSMPATSKGIEYDVLVAPHHGSKTSSSKAFINWVKPKYTVFSAGFMNRWHMPNKEVLGRYQQANIRTLNTAEDGMVEFVFKPSKLEINTFRTDIKPYWFAN